MNLCIIVYITKTNCIAGEDEQNNKGKNKKQNKFNLNDLKGPINFII